MGFGDGSIRKGAAELRKEWRDFRGKLREAKQGGLTAEEAQALAPEFLEVLQEGAELLGVSAEAVKDIVDFARHRL